MTKYTNRKIFKLHNTCYRKFSGFISRVQLLTPSLNGGRSLFSTNKTNDGYTVGIYSEEGGRVK